VTILRFLLGLLLQPLLSWWRGRQQAKQLAKVTQQAVTAEAKDAQAEAIIKTEEVRHAVDQEVERLPEAPPQRVGDAVPGTAAGELHKRWQRD